MKPIYPDLWQGVLNRFAGPLTIRAYYLKTDVGCVLFYCTNNLVDLNFIKESGGLNYQYLSHIHEVNPGLKWFKEELKHKTVAHNVMSDSLKEVGGLDIPIYEGENQLHSNAVLVIPTPGHTKSSLCYYYTSPFGKSYLFVGDTMYLDQGKWRTLIVYSDGGNKSDLKKSLLKLRTFDVDVIICSVALGDNNVVEVNQNSWHKIIDTLVDELN